MDESKTNIDLVFRNGLKDYEVLPPPEIWNNIKPVIRKKQKPFIILRNAAAVAVLLSLSFLAYRLSTSITSMQGDNIIDATEVSELQNVISVFNNNPPREVLSASEKNTLAQAIIPVNTEQAEIMTDNGQTDIPTSVYQPLSGRIYSNEQNPANSGLIRPFKPLEEELNILNTESLYTQAAETERKAERWTIAALVSPAYYTNFYAGKDEFASKLMNTEQPVFSYSGGVAFSYKINKKVSIQSGLYYSSFGQKLSGITSFAGFQQYDYTKSDRNFEVLTTKGRVYINNSDVFLLDSRSDDRIITRYTNDFFDPAKADLQLIDNSLRQNFSYLELPVIVRYKLIDKKMDFNLVGGLSSNFLVNNSVYAALDGDRYQVGKTEGMSMLTFSSSLGMGMEYNLSGNLSLNLEPTFRYYLNPFNQTPSLKIHPYSFGIFSGISYRF